MIVTVLLLALLGTALGADNVTIELDPSANNVTEGRNFTFTCHSSINVSYISILVDRADSGSKFDRITATPGTNSVMYTFANTMYTDDHTVFMCRANNGSMVYNSSEFTLDVFFAPRLIQGNNMTNLTELQEGTPHTLPVMLMAANPPVTAVMLTNDSTNSTGVTFVNNTNSGNITFTPGYPSNRGNYTVSFTNIVGTTGFTYRTFIGGVPDGVNVKCQHSTSSNNAVINCTLTDNSDAPATSVNISIGDITNVTVPFYILPATDVSVPAFSRNLNELPADNYTVSVTAFNQLGSSLVYNTSFSIDGKYTETVIKLLNDSVSEGLNFTFMCETPTANDTTFAVLVNNETNDRVIPLGDAVNGSQTFILSNVSWTDNGVQLRCIANGTWKSVEMPIDILYAPKFFGSVVSYLINGSLMDVILVNMSSNPQLSSHQWTHNGGALREGIMAGNTSLNFSVVMLADSGNYTLLAENIVGNNSYSFELDIYYAPVFHQESMLLTKKEGEKFELSINATAHPPVSSSNWLRNGQPVEASERIKLDLLNITITGIERIDSSVWTLNVSNEVGSSMYNFTLSVLYAPNITSETQFGYINSSYVLTVQIDANPSNYTTVWMKNGDKVTNSTGVVVTKDSISFDSLGLTDNGTYTVNTTNVAGSDQKDVVLAIYYGPIFANDTNSTVWVEYGTGDNVSLTCEVIASYPELTKLVISSPNYTNDSNWTPIPGEFNSITVSIPKASQENRDNYTCMGTNGKTSGFKTYQTFIGGAPDKTSVKISQSENNNVISLTITVTDSSEAPPRMITYTDPLKSGSNGSFAIPYPLIDGRAYTKNFYSAHIDKLQAGQPSMDIFASNGLGGLKVTNYKFTFPPTKPTTNPTKSGVKKSHAGAIAAGVIVPIVFIIILVAAGFGVYYYMKKRRTSYSPMRAMTDPDVTATTYGTTNS